MGIPKKNPEKKEELKGDLKVFEYKNAVGEKVCDAYVRLSSELIDLGMNRKGRRVLEFKLKGPGSMQQVDMLELARSKELGIPMYAFEGSEVINSSSTEKKRVIVTLGGTLLDAVTMLHEFGHAEQDQDPRFAAINELVKLDGMRKREEYIPFESLQLLKESIDVVFSPETLAQMREYGELERKELVLKKEIELIKKRKQDFIDDDQDLDIAVSIKKIKAIDDSMMPLQAEIDRTINRRKELIQLLEQVVRLPKLITERDATVRAFVKMRRVKNKKKIDLFAPVVLASTENDENYQAWKKYAGPKTDCASQIRAEVPSISVGEVSDAKTYFTQFGLWSYYGRTTELAGKYGSIPKPTEIIPIEEIDDVIELEPNMPPIPSERSARAPSRAVPPLPPLARPRNVPPPPPPIAGIRKSPPNMTV